jgi:hypothetical protein
VVAPRASGAGCERVVGSRSLLVLKSLAYEVEGYLVGAVFGVQAAARAEVEVVKVDGPEAAVLVCVPADLEGHLVHDAEDVPAGRLGDPDVAGLEAAERVDR